jgi:hypothetical protein
LSRGVWLVMSAAAPSQEENAMTDLVNRIVPRVGDTVYTADDHKIGTVKAFDSSYMTIEHGRLMKSDYYIPISAVNSQANGSMFLNVSKDEIGDLGWDAPPLIETDAGNPPLQT